MASSLTIAPSLGHSVVTAQGMAGGYDAIDDRAFWGVGLQEGAVEATAFEVTERAAGANMTVDVACDEGHVAVEGDTVDFQGLYTVRPHPSAANLDIATAHATLPRIDSVVVQVDDDEHDSGGNTRARVMVLTGTATSGADLDDRLGAPTLPDSAMLLADVLVPAADTSISNSQIRDRRKWARGAYARVASTGDLAVGADTDLAISARVECSGAPMELRLIGRFTKSASAGAVAIQPRVDGTADLTLEETTNLGANDNLGLDISFPYIPAAGSHVFTFRLQGAGTLHGANAPDHYIVIEEKVRQNTVNNATTSG